MAYTTPPQFTNGSVLSAAQMNILSDNQEHLKGVIDAQNAAVPSQELTADGSVFYGYRHQHDVLVFSYIITGKDNDTNDVMSARIYDDSGNWRLIYHHNMNQSDNDTVINEYWSYSAHTAVQKAKAYGEGTSHNYNASTVALTTGNHYQLNIEYDFETADEFKVRYIYNSTGTAI